MSLFEEEYDCDDGERTTAIFTNNNADASNNHEAGEEEEEDPLNAYMKSNEIGGGRLSRLKELQTSWAGKRKRGGEDLPRQKWSGQKSKIDKKNDSTRALLECSDRMRDSAAVMKDCIAKLNNPDESKDSQQKALETLSTSILPFLESGWKVVRSAAVATSSMASIDVAHDRMARREKKNVVALKSEKPPIVQLINHTTKKLAGSLAQSPPPGLAQKHPPPGEQPSVNISLDEPLNGSEYTKLEAVVQLRKTTLGSKERKTMMGEMMRLGYVPVKQRAMQRLMEQDAKGEVPILNIPWASSGPTPLLSDGDIDEFVQMLGESNSGITYDNKTIKNFIISKKKQRLSSEGYATIDDSQLKIDDKTVRNYMAIIGSHPNMRVVKCSVPAPRTAGIVARNTSRSRVVLQRKN